MTKRLFIIDAMAMAYRNFHALGSRLTTSNGRWVSAVFGSAQFMTKLLTEEKPDYLLVASDSQAKTFRHDLYPEYKANRKAMPNELSAQLPDFYRLFEAMDIPVLRQPGLEADDFIGSVARHFAAEGLDVYIVSGDKDFMQLVNDRVHLYSSKKDSIVITSAAGVFERYAVMPAQIIDMLAIMGDSSDNIPGVSGIGEKTAAKLIETYGSIEQLYENIDKISAKKLKENLITERENAFLSKKLVTIKTDCPINLSLEELACDTSRALSGEKLLALYGELEFRALYEKTRSLMASSSEKTLEEKAAAVVSLHSTSELGAHASDEAREPLAQEAGTETTAQTPREETDQASDKKEVSSEEINVKIRGDVSYQLVQSRLGLAALLELLSASSLFSFDSETTGLDVVADRPIGFSFAVAKGQAFYVPLIAKHLDDVAADRNVDATAEKEEARANEQEVKAFLQAVFSFPALKIAHNAKFDLQMLKNIGIDVAFPLADSMIVHYLIDPDYRLHNLDDCCLRHLGYRKIPTASLIGKKGETAMADVPLEALCNYACEDADFTLRLYLRLMAVLRGMDQEEQEGAQEGQDKRNEEEGRNTNSTVFFPENQLWSSSGAFPGSGNETGPLEKLFWQIEMPIVPVLAQMEQNGVYLMVDQLLSLSDELGLSEAKLQAEIYALAGEQFNINSPKQLQKILFEKLKVQEGQKIRLKKTKTGFSTDESVLVKLSFHPLVKLLLEYRAVSKLKSTYVDPLPQLINPLTSRVHTSFHQTGTATGRLSSSNPNMQNIPIRSQQGKKIRSAFSRQEEGSVIISADYSQIELRILAHLSEDEALLQAFKSGEDIHRLTAARVFGVALPEVTSEMRSRAKAINYGIVYGMGARRLASETGSTLEEASSFIEKYFNAYPKIRSYIDSQINLARQRGYTETMCGRRRYIRDIDSKNQSLADNAKNAVINSPIQGGAADLVKLAMLRVDLMMREAGLKTRLLLQVHDELLFEGPSEELEKACAIIREAMEGALQLRVELKADIGQGNDWLKAH